MKKRSNAFWLGTWIIAWCLIDAPSFHTPPRTHADIATFKRTWKQVDKSSGQCSPQVWSNEIPMDNIDLYNPVWLYGYRLPLGWFVRLVIHPWPFWQLKRAYDGLCAKRNRQNHWKLLRSRSNKIVSSLFPHFPTIMLPHPRTIM